MTRFRFQSFAPLSGLLLLTALSGCGSQRDLQPAAGATLPQAPYGRADRPSSAELLRIDPQATPARNVELREQSERRADDPFDLPPEG